MELLGLGEFFVCGKVANIFDDVAIREYFQKLCAKVSVECQGHFAGAQTATQTRDWAGAYSKWTSCKGMIVGSEDLFDRDEWLWLESCHKLVSAKLWAFHSKKFELALDASIDAWGTWNELKNAPESPDLRDYLINTVRMMIFLWASSDCEEETLNLKVKSYLVRALSHQRDGVPDFEVSTLKQQCKELVINRWECVIWEVQKQYFYYSETEECLRWVREGNNFYGDKYLGQLDYVSNLNEAAILFMAEACEEVIKVCENIREELKLMTGQANDTSAYPADQYCTVEYKFVVHQMLNICYRKMILKPNPRTRVTIEQQNSVNGVCNALWSQMELAGNLLPLRECLAESWEYAANNRWEQAKMCFVTYLGQSLCGQFFVLTFLDQYHTDFKIKYRQSYEGCSPDESFFSSAQSWAEILQQLKNYSSLSQWQLCNIVRHLRLYYEKDREVMFVKQTPNTGDVNKIVEYGREAIECYVEALSQPTKHDDYWIIVQQLYIDVYYMLQFHYFALWIRSHECTLGSTSDIEFSDRLQQLWNQCRRIEESSADSTSGEILKQSFLWVERAVGKAIYFQLAPDMLSVSATEQLAQFDLKDEPAWNILTTSRAACGSGTVVLEYFVSKTSDVQFVYVMTKEDEVFMQVLKINGLDSILSCLLKWSRKSFSKGHNCEWAPINANLEWLYEILIDPVSHFLDDMEVEDKLIIIAPQILSDVPFAALRKPNSLDGEGYLIQNHTISITPSLRMLHLCKMRSIELGLKGKLVAEPGTIVAVGDPVNSIPLPGSAEEVKSIENLFGEEYVKKLVRSEATPANVLEWAEYPSKKDVKQVVFHIAAHGDQEGGKGGIVLSPPAQSQQNDGRKGVHRDEERVFDDDTAHNETKLLNGTVNGKEKAQILSCGEIGGMRSGKFVPISKDEPHILKSENISGCGFQWEAHMVVLSTCDSARGQITGEGVLNLPRALMFAGIPSVVASQWKVNDHYTLKLMKSFYEELSKGKDVSSALRAAMLEMIKNKGEVHKWAPFFVCGLPTVCLPIQLQAATSSDLCDDSGTSSVTKPKRRLKRKVRNVRMKAVPTIDLITSFYQLLENASENTCWECMADLAENLDFQTDLAEFGIKLELSNHSNWVTQLKNLGKMMESLKRQLQSNSC